MLAIATREAPLFPKNQPKKLMLKKLNKGKHNVKNKYDSKVKFSIK